MREKKNPGGDDVDSDPTRRRYSDQGRDRARERFTRGPGTEERRGERQSEFAGLGSNNNGSAPQTPSGNAGSGMMMRRRDSEEEEDEESVENRRRQRRNVGCKRFLRQFNLILRRSN